MTTRSINKSQIKLIALSALIIFLFVGTLSVLISSGSPLYIYFQSLVYTIVCTITCTILITRWFDAIRQYPRLIFFLIFTVLVVAGIFLGVVASTLLLEQRLQIKTAVLQFSLLVGFVASIVITGYMVFREKLEQNITRLKEVEIENEKLKRLELEARLSSLQAKLNPHFLFNTLNSTAALIYDNPARAEESIVQLSDLYRKIFSISDQNFITLGEELDLIEDMLQLEKLRFEDKLTFHIACASSLRAIKIPGLLIEPLVENVMKHAPDSDDHLVQVAIEIKRENDYLDIAVTDNGAGFDVAKADLGYGLYSIQERLRLLFGERAGLDIDSAIGKGTRVRMWMPILVSSDQ
ncbi:MAG: histidine kinase [candidate division KSB1 bacterium]|nr:histidine kinase [candidate division KSB1 bacterium]